MKHNPFESSVILRQESLLATNSVLRNTYFLLGLTLLFSALTATFSMLTHALPLNIFPMFILTYGLMFLTTRLRNSPWGIPSIFAFTGFMGYTLGPILNYYVLKFDNGAELIMLSLGTTGMVFAGLSAYILITKKNMKVLSGFLFAGSLTLIVLMLASIWIQTTALQLAIAGGFVLFSSAMILYHTSAIVHGGERNYIMATISLYLALFNMFLSLLRLLGELSNRK